MYRIKIIPSVSSNLGLVLVTFLTMFAFAANSLLTRFALQQTAIDPALFTATRLIFGALVLALILGFKGIKPSISKSGLFCGFLLFLYAAAFSFAYKALDTGVGALILFATSQLLMISVGLLKGEKANFLGVFLAFFGLVAFLAPDDMSAPLSYMLLMVLSGLAWGGFSLLGKKEGSPILHTANSFLLAVPFAFILLAMHWQSLQFDVTGLVYAALCGAVTSALGYVIWYWVRVQIPAITAGTVQLSVPVISALLGWLFLSEVLLQSDIIFAVVILFGVALTLFSAKNAK